ncbi:nucleoid-associated protein [Stenotrophomonas sp. PS02300]|uniref:nucleoid-associated protein n=1 Tax=Stenotrophomonas sp. PS02300 TaxID=2991426 RepID=UPI00249A2B81|nr:nucleoid-associated protein [Stenotrophomonas sp. PS02300]
MNVLQATIHRLSKDQYAHGAGSVEIQLRDTLLVVDQLLSRVAEQTVKLFAKRGNNTGTFGDDEDVYRFPVRLKEYRDMEIDFLELSQLVVGIIESRMQSVVGATGGHAFFLHYEQGGVEYLLVAMLKLRDGAGISEDLELEPALVIDTDKLHEAAKVSFARWENGEDAYLTFVKARGTDEVSAYFRDALACVNYTSAQQNTERMIEAARAYVLALGLNEDDTQERWKATKERLFQCFENGRSGVVLETISAAVEPGEPELFSGFVTEGPQALDLMVSHQFVPHVKTFRKLRRLSAKMGTVSVAFDVEDAAEGRVKYDPEADALVIPHPTDDIREVLRQYGQDPTGE